MTKPLRLALIALPAASLGALSWVPFLWLAITRPKTERPTYLYCFSTSLLAVIAAYVWAVVASVHGDTVVFNVAVFTLCLVAALAATLTYLMTAPLEKSTGTPPDA